MTKAMVMEIIFNAFRAAGMGEIDSHEYLYILTTKDDIHLSDFEQKLVSMYKAAE